MTLSPRYQPVPSSVPDFAYEFVSKMRKCDDVRVYPSVRQTQSIAEILSSRFFRKGFLTLDDFIDAAVFTTYPADQDIARLLAEEIILGTTKEVKAESKDVDSVSTVKTVEKDQLQKVMEQIRKEQELAKTIRKDKVEAGFEYLQMLRKRTDRSLLDVATDYLKEGDIVLRGISSDEQLRTETSKELLEKLGNLAARDILNASTLGVLPEVERLGSTSEQVAAASILTKTSDLFKRFEDLSDRDPTSAAKALSLIEQMKSVDKSELEKLQSKLEEHLQNLSDAADFARHLKRVPRTVEDLIDSAAKQYYLSQSIEFGKSIEKSTGKNFSSNILNAYDKHYEEGARKNVDMAQLAESAQDSDSWERLVQKLAEDTVTDALSRSSSSDFLRMQVRQADKLSGNLRTTTQAKAWEQMMQRFADNAIRKSPTKLHIRQTVRDLTSHGIVLSREVLEKAGKRLGMTDDEIEELINPSFQVIKKLIEIGVDDFDRLHSLVSSAALSFNQLKELADVADAQDNQSALGAIAHENLAAALGGPLPTSGYGRHSRGRGSGFGGFDPSRTEKVMGGLLGGSATNIVKIWYTYRDSLPDELRKRLKSIAKRLLIDLGQRYAKATMGSSMLGGIQQSTTVRPFRIGDDIDLIDLEETIDSILSAGRSDFDTLDAEDFLIAETYQGHRAFFWALDKSSSMDTPEKLGMLAISVMAGLYGIQKDDFGVALFDSKTHIVKELADKSVSVDKVAADLLEVHASGGTGGRTVMKLALENFRETKAKEKIFVFSTDAYLFDQSACEDLAVDLKHHDIQMIILVPKHEYDRHAAERLAKLNHGIVLDIASVDELPEKLLRVTNY